MTNPELLALVTNPPKRQAVAHITPEIQAKIRALAADGVEHGALSRRFDIHRFTISKIVNHRGIWK